MRFVLLHTAAAPTESAHKGPNPFHPKLELF
jgi:hypothetical protein